MYWERKEDCNDALASCLMTKNEFMECKKYLHLADSDNLDLLRNILFFMKPRS